ncbi:hypothetical protein TIFTF001_025854 [Ficus carica]|uniref:Uncharacterized protein n=1 Tax=Ficus carica TaxID=3494 RepID=A0AA88APN3_FICCA|nr:hypothetical protein TIFTF001_025854 [Ficus carica]
MRKKGGRRRRNRENVRDGRRWQGGQRHCRRRAKEIVGMRNLGVVEREKDENNEKG